MSEKTPAYFCIERDRPVHILIIEDEKDLAGLIGKAFLQTQVSNRLTIVHSLAEARPVIANDLPDLIIADWMLPDGTGIEILPRLGGVVTTPLIIFTGHGNENLAVEIMKSGAIDYVVKSESTLRDLPHIAWRSLREWDDIQKRKKAQESLRSADLKYRELFENSGTGIVILDREGTYLLVNQCAADNMGAAPDEIVGRSLSDFLPCEIAQKYLVHNQEIIDSCTRSEYEDTFELKTGTKSFFIIDQCLKDSQGQGIAIQSSSVDISARKMSEEALRQSESRYRILHESIRDAFASVGMDGRLQDFNGVFLDLFGYSRDELTRLTYRDLTPHKWHEMEAAIVEKQVLSRGYSDVYEKEYRKKDGTVFPVELRTILIRDEHGQPTGMWAIIRDITARKREEQKIAESEEKYRGIFSAESDPIFLIDRDTGSIVDVNDAACRLYGYSREELLQMKGTDVSSEPEKSEKSIREVIPVPLRYHKKRDGTIFPVEISVSSLTLDGRRIVLGVVRDRSEQKQLQELLIEEKDRAKNLLDIAGVIILALDTRGIVTLINERGSEILGYPKEEIVGKAWVDTFLPEGIREDMKKAFLALRAGELAAVGNYENPVLTARGEERIISWINTDIRDPKGAIIGTLSSGEDITQRRKTETALRESENRYRNLFENMREGFAYCRMIYEDGAPSDFIYLNVNQSFNRIIGPGIVIGKRVTEVFPGIREAMPRIFEIYGRVAQTGIPESFELDFKPSGKWLYLSVYSPEPGYFVATFEDITQHKFDDDVRNLSSEVLQLSHQHANLASLLDEYVCLIQHYTGCDSVGIRLLDMEGNIPYAAYAGFTKNFYEKESPLSIRNDQCMCINVIKGTTDPQLPFYTKAGSFYMNGTTKFLATVSEEEKGKTRNVCNEAGYESVALIPFREHDRILGLIHLADHHVDMVPIRIIEILEKVANSIGEAVKRLQVEEELKKSEIRFRSLIQNSSDIIRILDASGRIVYDSPSSERLLGYPAGFFIGKTPVDFVHPGDRNRVTSELQKVLSKENSGIPTEFRIRKADGEYIYVDSIGVNLIGVPGIDGIVVTTRPIQERKTAELALRESEEQYRLLFENAQDAIFLHEMLPDGRPGQFIMVNSILCQQLGYSLAELMQMKVLDIISPRHPSVVPAIVQKVKSDGHATFEEFLERKDGSDFPVEVSTHLFELHGRNVSLSFARDITDRKKSEQDLIFRNALLAAQNEVSIDGILAVDENQQILLYNRRFIEMWKIPPEMVISGLDTPLLEHNLSKVKDREDFLLKVRYLYDNRNVKSRDEIVLSDGSVFDRYSAPMVGTDGRYYGRIWYFRDITEQKAADVALRENEARLAQAMDLAKIVNWELDIQTGAFTFDDRFYAFFGTSAEREGGTRMTADVYAREFIHPDDVERVAEEIGKAITTTDPAFSGQVEHRIIRRDGEIRYVAVHYTVVFDSLGNHTKNRGVNQDITERKIIEIALQENEERLAKAMDLAMLVSWDFNPATQMYTFDDRFYAMYGTTAEREGGTLMPAEVYLREFAHPDDVRQLRADLETVKKIRSPHSSGQIEHRIIRRDGEVRYIVVHYSVVTDAAGNQVKSWGVNHDITERKRYELAIAESEEKFRTLVENVVDVFYRSDRNGILIYASPSALTLTGYPSLDDLIGRPIVSFWENPEDREKMLSILGERGSVKDFEVSILRFDGTKIPVSISSHFFRDESGAIAGVEGVIRDISERKKYETDLRESEEKFRMIFDTDQDALIVFEITANGMPGKIIDANLTACTQLGYTKDELQTKNFFEINADEYWESALNQMAGLYLRGNGSYESVRIKKDGARFPVEVQVHRMKLQGRDVIVSSARDVSDRRRQEKSLKISNQKLHLMNIVAWHDIQNKITGLRGYVELTKDIVADEKGKAFVKTEEDVLKVIDQQIQYTKEYQQMGVAPPEWLFIGEMLRRVIGNQNAGRLDVAIDVGDLEIFCDPTVEKAFAYLVGFTLDPSRNANTVRIYLRKNVNGLVLCYDDNGSGISLDKKNEIFLRDVAKFSGFGMFFIHDILDISDMSIRETGDPDKGVRFEISVPKGIYRYFNAGEKKSEKN